MLFRFLFFYLFISINLCFADPILITGFKPVSETLNSTIKIDREWIDSTSMGSTFFPAELPYFIRDILIQRIDGKILVPVSHPSMRMFSFSDQVRGSLPLAEQRSVPERKPGARKALSLHGDFGLRSEAHFFAGELAKSLGLEIEKSHSVLEGGNVFVLPKLGRAIVGVHSVALTLIAQESGWIEVEEEIKPVSKEQVTEHAFLIARNQAHLKKGIMKPLEEVWGILAEPVAEDQKESLLEAAMLWQAKWNFAEQAIARDLGLDVSQVTFVIQQNYHLDYDIAVHPDGLIFQNAATQPALAEIQATQLMAQGWKVISITDGSPKSGFINGLFLGNQYVSLNAPTAEFSAALKASGLEPVVLDGFAGFSDETSGGLRCLSLELLK